VVAIYAVFANGHLTAAFRSGQTLHGVGGRAAGNRAAGAAALAGNATHLKGAVALAGNATQLKGAVALAGNATQLKGAVALAGNATQLRGWSKGASKNATQLRGWSMKDVKFTLGHEQPGPCQCEPLSFKWSECTRTVPKCIFIDFGAAHGNTFEAFLRNSFGNVSNCPSGQWEAVLVEANPFFEAPLLKLAAKFNGTEHRVHSVPSTAAWICESTTTFYLDTVNRGVNYWGSSMSPSHPDVIKSGFANVTLPTVNLNRILFEKTILSDWVIVKVDVEGAEWGIIPCLASSPLASHVDRLFLETHPADWSTAKTTGNDMERAKAELKRRGVDMPMYNSLTL